MRTVFFGLAAAAGLVGCVHQSDHRGSDGDAVQVCRPGSAVIYTRSSGRPWPGERVLTRGGSCRNP